jgi:hypothetical protein
MAMTYDRAAIMRDAWGRYRDGKRLSLGWTFGQCLTTAWAAAKMRRAAQLAQPPTIETRRNSSLARIAA